MKTILAFILPVLLLLNCKISAQAPPNIQELEKNYEDYFELNREVLFLHLNKTSVVPEENIWISAYVYNPKLELPNWETVNLNITIHDGQGNHIESKTILITKGKGSSFIKLDSDTYKPGNYFLKASTAFMKNFEEDLSYVQAFTILGEETESSEEDIAYDLQVLPEGGHLLAGVINSAGVKLINDSGAGVSFTSGKILDSNHNEVVRFNSNRFGISKFSFIPEHNEEYTAVITLPSGREITHDIEAAEPRGISITSSERNNEFIFSIKTNELTRKDLDNKRFFFAVHKDGFINDFEFQFPDQKLEVNLGVSKDSLFLGVNTITIFDRNLQPVLERMIFNEKKLKRSHLEGRMIARPSDSLIIELKDPAQTEHVSLSISVLPSETTDYNPQHNIISAFYLKPYLKGNIDQPSYYFSRGNERRKFFDLDLLLLTQGWSKHNWEKIFNTPPREYVEPEVAFGFEGEIQNRNKKREKTLLIRSNNTELFEMVEIQEDDSFRLENIYLVDSSDISFGLMNDRNNKVKRPELTVDIFPQKNRLDLNDASEFQYQFRGQPVQESLPDNFLDGAVSLDTVMIESARKNTAKTRNERSALEQETEITDEIANQYHYITDYLSTKGFVVKKNFWKGLRILSTSSSSVWNPDRNVLIIFNGAEIGKDASILQDLQSSEVESIVINKRGAGFGMQGGNGVIKINTKKGGSIASRRNMIHTIITENGFTENKKFYAPKYNSYSNAVFRTHGAIDWRPGITLDSIGTSQFKVVNLMQPEIRLYIEGMNAEGVLFSEVLTIETR